MHSNRVVATTLTDDVLIVEPSRERFDGSTCSDNNGGREYNTRAVIPWSLTDRADDDSPAVKWYNSSRHSQSVRAPLAAPWVMRSLPKVGFAARPSGGQAPGLDGLMGSWGRALRPSFAFFVLLVRAIPRHRRGFHISCRFACIYFFSHTCYGSVTALAAQHSTKPQTTSAECTCCLVKRTARFLLFTQILTSSFAFAVSASESEAMATASAGATSRELLLWRASFQRTLSVDVTASVDG